MSNASSFTVTVADWATWGTKLAQVRETVFVGEQGVPAALEADGLDGDSARCIHAVALDADQNVIGTARLLLDKPLPRIGRMAVLKKHRRTGVGAALLELLCEEAARRGNARVTLHAQTHASGFYYHHGFLSYEAEFFEAGIPHQEMRRELRPGT